MAFSARLPHPSADFLPPFTLPQTKAYYVTVPSKKIGERIARTLVESKLAACVNIIPGVESVYIWEDKVRTPLCALSVSPSLPDPLASLVLSSPETGREGPGAPVDDQEPRRPAGQDR